MKERKYFWTHGFNRKGPINSDSSVRSSIRSFTRNADISGSAPQNFLIFCTKLEQHKCRKVTFSDFRKKLLSGVKRSNMAQNWTFSKIASELRTRIFRFFCMKLDDNKAFQTIYMLSS